MVINMENKCKCYHPVFQKQTMYSPLTQEYTMRDVEIGICYGTKECERCSCSGDKLKCNFYPEYREEAAKNITIEDAIEHFKHGISHDIFSEPVTTYAKLAVEALEEQISKR